METISRGPTDDNGRCTNGSIAVARAGDNLAWARLDLVNGEIVTAYGVLSRKSNPQGAPPAEEEQLTTETTKVTPQPVRKPVPATPPAPLH
jgi:hypothetical protein